MLLCKYATVDESLFDVKVLSVPCGAFACEVFVSNELITSVVKVAITQ
jgi:hypothetical protein